MDCSRDLLHYKSYLWIFPLRKIEVVSLSHYELSKASYTKLAKVREALKTNYTKELVTTSL
jgi:hypothetical protein